MDKTAIDWLNDNLTIGIGTFIALLFFTLTIFNTINAIRDKISNKIRNETLENEDLKNLKDSVNKLITTVDTLKQSVDNVNTHLVETENKFTTNIESSNNKIDNVLAPKLSKLEAHVNDIETEERAALDNITEYNKLAIKSFIITEYRKWMELGHIDIYQLSIIEDQFKIYTDVYHGNTFILEMMNQLRKLSAHPVITDDDGNDPIHYFELHPENDPRNINRDD